MGLAEESRDVLTAEVLDNAYRRTAANYDRAHGGFVSSGTARTRQRARQRDSACDDRARLDRRRVYR